MDAKTPDVAWTNRSGPRSVLILTLAMFAALDAGAWGPAAHFYIAHHIFGADQPASLYGAMAPDMCDCELFNPAAKGAFKHITHYDFDLLAPSPFARGFATHNQKWGGDAYAHAYLIKELTAEYPKVLFEQLSRETGISVHDAEDSIELSLDYMIRRDWGPELGKLVASCADAVGEAEKDALVKAFAAPFAKSGSGYSEAEAAEHIRMMFDSHRLSITYYGQMLAMDEDRLRALWLKAFVVYFGLKNERAEELFKRACELCKDWREHLDIIADEIAAHIELRP